MIDDYKIHLNFLSVLDELPEFTIYRKLRHDSQEQNPEPGILHAYSLPREKLELENRDSYWVSLEQRADFAEFRVRAGFNRYLTCWVLINALSKSVVENLKNEDFWIPERSFLNEIYFCMRRHNEGEEQLVVQPYFLKAAKKFGFLVDFHFRLREDVGFSRRVQQLSLSLDGNFKRNLDAYIDRIVKIKASIKKYWPILSQITLPNADRPISLSLDFEPLPATPLRPRIYLFGINGDKADKNQFSGLMAYGPIRPLSSVPNLLFMFREQDRQAARTLAVALRGSQQRERFNFPGFEKLFKTSLNIDPNPVVLSDFSVDTMKTALNRVEENQSNIPILIMPDNTDEGYWNYKSVFAHAGIPSQACTLNVIQGENSLKYSVSNIALQIFCKAGGHPWRVRPTDERCLIIGISQSHKVRKGTDGNEIEKYFAFSVLTDSSGLFQKIQVLGEANTEVHYLERLRNQLQIILHSNAKDFSRIVVHTSFKLRQREIAAIQDVAQQTAKSLSETRCRFAVVKVNHKSRFFGINQSVNSLVPYEGTYVRLGHDEYLIWFEGIFPDKPTVTKAFSGPTHLQFLRTNDRDEIGKEVLLQDLVNLSGANWRGFNAKSTPVSVFYCHLVADLVQEFQKRGLPLPAIEELRPWFL